MTTYEPGRIYSGIHRGTRVPFLAGEKYGYVSVDGDIYEEDIAKGFEDVRGPLVVLDPPDGVELQAVADEICGVTGISWLCDQIEDQIRPPLQVGWHEVKEFPHPMYFGGGDWRYAPSRLRPKNQSLTSTHYIGPASGDSNE